MITCILGKTCSGKDTIVNKLVEEYGYKKIVTYTTRPMRDGEVQDKTYHFISEEEFKELIKNGFFAEWKIYKTVQGIWYYGSAKEDFENPPVKGLIILTPKGYRDVLLNTTSIPKSIYIVTDTATRYFRLGRRGDDIEEANRRCIEDDKDFIGVYNLADRILPNSFKYNINTIVCEVNDIITKWEEEENGREES